MRLPTVTVDRNGTPVVINRSDYRPDRDRLWAAPVAEAVAEAAPVEKTPQTDPEAERQALFAKLAEKGIRPHHRTGLAKLREMAEG